MPFTLSPHDCTDFVCFDGMSNLTITLLRIYRAWTLAANCRYHDDMYATNRLTERIVCLFRYCFVFSFFFTQHFVIGSNDSISEKLN